MEKIIIIKYAELSTKKENINFFIKLLKKNIESSLKNLNIACFYDRGRMIIICLEEDIDSIIKKLKLIFGIHEINVGYKMELKSIDEISIEILTLIESYEYTTFKVETKRSDKSYPQTSMEISKNIGEFILKNTKDKKVDVHSPELLINIEIRQQEIFVYFDKIIGLGGFPTSSLGKALLMLSGGIDSPVAGYLAMKKGIKLEAIYFESPPHTSWEAKNKVIKLCEKLAQYNLGIKLHVINFTQIQESIYKNIPHEYLITIMRRIMYRISEHLAYNRNAHAIINGESIGQVASQTLTSMQVINEVVKIPIIRPLACFDKNEIINLAKKIDTYETSILPFEDCCTIFVPEHPIINPDYKKCLEYESLIDVKPLIKKALENHEVVQINKEMQGKYQDIL